MFAFDAHNHLQALKPLTRQGLGPHALIDATDPLSLGALLVEKDFGWAANATCEEDWVILESMHQTFHGHMAVGFGIHPWWADSAQVGWLERLDFMLQAHPAAFIGESGLDGYRATRPCGIALETQRQILLPQLTLAKDLNRPIVLHCVKAWEHLAAYLQQTGVRRFLIHRFRGSSEMAHQIVKLGGMISVHIDTLCHQQSMDAIRQISLSSLLVETDYDGPRAEALPIPDDLENTIEGLSRIINVSSQAIREQCCENALRFYEP